MYFWEIFSTNPTLLAILSFVIIIPLYFICIIGLTTNKYFVNMNQRQKGYWIIAIFTGSSIGMLILLMIGLSFLYLYTKLLFYIESFHNIYLMLLMTGITFSLIIAMFYSLNKKVYPLSKIYTFPLDYWKKILKEKLEVNIYLKEKDGGS